MRDTFLYISLPFLHDHNVKMPSFMFDGGRKQAPTKIPFSFWTWIRLLRIQPKENNHTFDNWSKRVGIITIRMALNRDGDWKTAKQEPRKVELRNWLTRLIVKSIKLSHNSILSYISAGRCSQKLAGKSGNWPQLPRHAGWILCR